MQRYARIQAGLIAEIFSTDQDITALFNPDLLWVPVPDDDAVTVGRRFENGSFMPPLPIEPPAAPTLVDLQTQLTALTSRIAALTSRPS